MKSYNECSFFPFNHKMQAIKRLSKYRLVTLLLAVHVALALTSMRRLSLTWDEPSYIGAGWQFLKTGNPQIVSLQLHPPLSYYLNSLLLLPLKLDAARFSEAKYLHQEYVGLPLIFESGYSPKLLIFLSRVPFVLMSALLAMLIWHWSRRIYGESAGLLSLFFYALSPIVLANCRLATPDIVLALTMTASLYAFHRYLFQPTPARLCVSGLMLGLALLSKFTALLLILTFVFAVIMYHRTPRTDQIGPRYIPLELARALAIFAIAFLVIWAGYGFQLIVPFIPEWLEPEAGRLVIEKPFWQAVQFLSQKGIHVPAYSYFLGIYTQLAAAKGWHNNFLFGRISQSGWWYFYWVAFFIKNTIPFLICLAAGLFVRRHLRAENEDERLLLYSMIPLVLFFSLPTKINIGVRYLLPLIPLLCILAGKAASLFRGRWRLVLAAFCIWQIAAVAWIHPHYFAYFNELVGGPSSGYKYLVDSNLDWGQDLERLSDYLKEHQIQDAKIRYFGPPGVLKYYGLEEVGPDSCEPAPGVWAVSATYLQGMYLDDPKSYRWLRKLKPTHVIGYTIFIYDVSDEELRKGPPGNATG